MYQNHKRFHEVQLTQTSDQKPGISGYKQLAKYNSDYQIQNRTIFFIFQGVDMYNVYI